MTTVLVYLAEALLGLGLQLSGAVPFVSICDVFDDPDKYDGSHVSLRGEWINGYEQNSIRPHGCKSKSSQTLPTEAIHLMPATARGNKREAIVDDRQLVDFVEKLGGVNELGKRGRRILVTFSGFLEVIKYDQKERQSPKRFGSPRVPVRLRMVYKAARDPVLLD